MPHQLEPGAMTYEAFYGLREKPFSLAADPKFLYLSRSHTVAYDKILAGIRRREGLLVLTGDIGTGKTTLCRAALQALDRKTFCAFVPDPFASREDLLKILLMDFGVTSIRELTTGPLRDASRTELSYLLSAFLETLVPLEAFVVVIIDEAQNMSPSLIEEIRILSDWKGRHGQLQVLFVGQLELHDRLKLPEMRQVDQRVCVYSRLDPLGPEDVRAYVHHRLQVAGGSLPRVHFFSDTFEMLHAVSRGVPRLINRICDRALHVAYMRRITTVDPAILEAALQEIGPELVQAALAAAAAPARPPAVAAVAAAPPQALASAEASTAPAATEPADGVHDWPSGPEGNVPLQAAPVVPVPEPDAALAEAHSAPGRIDDHEAKWREGMAEELRPEPHLRSLRRLWLRRARTAALHFAIWSAVAVAAVHGISTWGGASTSRSPQTVPSASDGSLAASTASGIAAVPGAAGLEPPRPAHVPAAYADAAAQAAGPATALFVVEVALFRTDARADQLVDSLAADGFAAFQRRLTLDSGRVLQQVLLGPFSTPEDTIANLERLKQKGGFDDARAAVLTAQ